MAENCCGIDIHGTADDDVEDVSETALFYPRPSDDPEAGIPLEEEEEDDEEEEEDKEENSIKEEEDEEDKYEEEVEKDDGDEDK